MSRTMLLDTDEPGVQVGIQEKNGAVNFVQVKTVYDDPIIEGDTEIQVITITTKTGSGWDPNNF